MEKRQGAFYKNSSQPSFRRTWNKAEYLMKPNEPSSLEKPVETDKALGFNCQLCNISFTCSKALIDHKISKTHLNASGIKKQSQKVTAESVRARLQALAKKP